jgi:hypothetical protein
METQTRQPRRPPRKRPAAPRRASSPRAGKGTRLGGSQARKDEPFVGLLFHWHNCHRGAWNKPILITNTSERIDSDQQHGPAQKSRQTKSGIYMDIPRIYHVYPRIMIYYVYPLWIYMEYPWIYHVCPRHRIYHVYTWIYHVYYRHIENIPICQ